VLRVIDPRSENVPELMMLNRKRGDCNLQMTCANLLMAGAPAFQHDDRPRNIPNAQG